eukprot:GCRY01002301.1.p1 GENE.GCRY01002301.1~~GCRY01002301.1.p1  ORF type:complete len:554 (-),score=133.68 GCRY01002301.1:115-1776(-)
MDEREDLVQSHSDDDLLSDADLDISDFEEDENPLLSDEEPTQPSSSVTQSEQPETSVTEAPKAESTEPLQKKEEEEEEEAFNSDQDLLASDIENEAPVSNPATNASEDSPVKETNEISAAEPEQKSTHVEETSSNELEKNEKHEEDLKQEDDQISLSSFGSQDADDAPAVDLANEDWPIEEEETFEKSTADSVNNEENVENQSTVAPIETSEAVSPQQSSRAKAVLTAEEELRDLVNSNAASFATIFQNINLSLTQLLGVQDLVENEPAFAGKTSGVRKIRDLLTENSKIIKEQNSFIEDTLEKIEALPSKAVAHKRNAFVAHSIFANAQSELNHLKSLVEHQSAVETPHEEELRHSHSHTENGKLLDLNSQLRSMSLKLERSVQNEAETKLKYDKLYVEHVTLKRQQRDAEKNHRETLKNYKANYFDELLKLKKDYNYEMEKSNEKAKSNLESMKQKHDADLKALIQKHEDELDKVRMESAEQAFQMQEQIAQIISQVENSRRGASEKRPPSSSQRRNAAHSPNPKFNAEHQRKKYNLPDYGHVQSKVKQSM